jgi:S-adenosylmethionine decarboxylase
MNNAERTGEYGRELILDLHSCNVETFSRRRIGRFCIELCELIDMEACDLHFWDDVGVAKDEQQTHPKTKGTSAVQFILTSTIVIHTLDLMEAAYVNIFSCKEFDTDKAAEFTAKWFGSTEWTAQGVIRR